MAYRTRSTTSSPVKRATTSLTKGEELTHEAVKVLILPENISEDARILPLQHPTDGSAKQFLFCPKLGLYELKKTSAPSTDPRSIIFAPPFDGLGEKPAKGPRKNSLFGSGYVNKSAEMLTATPYDIAFILLRNIAPRVFDAKKKLFQPLEDLLDSSDRQDKSLQYILREASDLLTQAMGRICDSMEAGDENLFRYNEEKVFNMILQKARKVAEAGLPTSLEERFVTRLLEAPILSVKRENSTTSVATPLPAGTDDITSQANSFDSQSTTESTAPSTIRSEVSAVSTVLTLPEDDIPLDIKHLQRIKTAFNLITATCAPPYVSNRLASLLTGSQSALDFTPLEVYLKRLSDLRAEAAASRSLSDFSRKRGLEDDELAEEKAEKRRKQQEDEKRKKANESRGVRDLKKVNVSGMKTMSHFFSKAPATAKAKS